MSAARAAYRALLRARAQAFAGDVRALTASHEEIRARFEEARSVDRASGARMVREAEEAAAFILSHVVQASRVGDEGAFRMKVEARHAERVTVEGAGEAAEEKKGGGGCCGGHDHKH